MGELEDAKEQLEEVRELLTADPSNGEFLKLENDLLELINLLSADHNSSSVATGGEEKNDGDGGSCSEWQAVDSASQKWEPVVEQSAEEEKGKNDDDAVTKTGKSKSENPPKKKKKSKKKEASVFEVPENLVILETDSEQEKKRKSRIVKNLKNKFREKQKEKRTTENQQSWKNFNKKKRAGTRQESIWATSGDDGKVGVVGKRAQSEYSERKRYKMG